MEVDKQNLLNIFNSNFSFPIVETPLGKGIKMDSYNAFLYSVVTGAGYFDNPVLPFTPKGLLKIFYNAFDYNFVSGMFEKATLKNTPYNLSLAKPYIFKGDKYIIPIEFERDIKLMEYLDKQYDFLTSQGINTTDFLIQRIEKSKKGNGMEPFMEYLTAETFKQKGYVVENQIPLAHSLGSPDFAGYKIKECFDFLNQVNLFTSGFHLIELSLIRIFSSNYQAMNNRLPYEQIAVVGEAKTGTRTMTAQLEKYLNTNLFSKGFEIHPDKTLPEKEYFGLVTIDSDYNIVVKEPQKDYLSVNSNYKEEDYYDWLSNYMKFYLLSNLTNDELSEFHIKETGRPISSTNDLVKLVNTRSYYDIYNVFMKEGS